MARLDLPLPYGPVHVKAPCPLSDTWRAMLSRSAADDCGQTNPFNAPGSPRSVSMRMAPLKTAGDSYAVSQSHAAIPCGGQLSSPVSRTSTPLQLLILAGG